ncbi:MAG: hypothetical protein HRF40_04215 [Nitrososphaera sp.]
MLTKNNYEFLGIVQKERFKPLIGEHRVTGTFRLTQTPMHGPDPPESGEIRLDKYEEAALLVRGIDRNGWIYSATIIEQAGPMLSIVIKKLFGKGKVKVMSRSVVG